MQSNVPETTSSENRPEVYTSIVNRAVDDEALRHRIRRILAEKPDSKLSLYSKHPLTTLVVGFLLTWLVGGILTDNYRKAQLENERIAEANRTKRDSAITAVNALSQLIYERRTRAELLASAIRRNLREDELVARKLAYDDAYVRWNINLQGIQLTIRDIVGNLEYSEVESYVQYGLTPHLTELDSYLTAGYDARIRKEAWEHDANKVRKHLAGALDCAYTITDYLWVVANLYEDNSGPRQALERSKLDLRTRCPKV